MKSLRFYLRFLVILFLVSGIMNESKAQWINGPNGGYIKSIIEHNGNLFAMSNSKLFISDDNAQTWTDLDMSFLPFNVTLFEFVENDNFIFASTSIGLFRSSDSGNSWQLKQSYARDICLHENTLFIVLANDSKVYRSQDNGDTWVQKHSPIIENTPWYDLGRLSFNGSLLFLGSVNVETALYRSADLGETWEHITNGLEMPGFPMYYIGPKQALFTDSAIFLATWFGIYKSVDNGLSWTVNLYDENEGCEKLFKSGELLVARGYSEKYWLSTDAINWIEITVNFPGISSIIEFDSLPSKYSAEIMISNEMIGDKSLKGSKHIFSNIGVYRTHDNLSTHYETETDGMVAWPTEPGMVVGDEDSVLVLAGGRVFKTGDGGQNWNKVYEGLGKLRKSNNLIWGTSGSGDEIFYFSTDGGQTWKLVEGAGTNNLGRWMAELNGDIFYVTNDGLFKSSDFGNTWVQKTFLLGYYKIFATETTLFANVTTSSQRGIHRSTDGGETWINTGLGNAIYFDWDLIEHNGKLFAGVDYTTPRGVWRSSDNGTIWENVNDGNKFRKFASNGSKLYFSEYDPNTQKYPVYMSADDGDTWTVIIPSSENIFTADSLYLYAMSAPDHVLRTGNDGQTWENISAGYMMYRPRINGMVIANKSLYVGTMRTGYYIYSLKEPAATVNTLYAEDISSNSATLYGSVNPNGSSCNVVFEFGQTVEYGNTAEAIPFNITGSLPVLVNTAIEGLEPNTTYNFRVVATNIDGVYYGPNKTFTTLITGVNSKRKVQVAVFPNPNNGKFSISWETTNDQDVMIMVQNSLGLTVYQEMKSIKGIGSATIEIILPSLSNGIYFVILQTEIDILINKIMVN